MKKPLFRSRREKVEAELKENEYVFDSAEMCVELIGEKAALGLQPVCACCGARLDFALSPAGPKGYGVPLWVCCPKNLNHCQIACILARERRDWPVGVQAKD